MKKILFLLTFQVSYFSFALKTDCQNLKNGLAELKNKQNILNSDLNKNTKQYQANQDFLNAYNKDCRSQKNSNTNSNCNAAMYSMISSQMPSLSVHQDQLKAQIIENKLTQEQSAAQYKLCSKK
jgi:hypothetical protein